MDAEWDLRARTSASDAGNGASVLILPLIPVPAEIGGGELLALAAFGSVRLPIDRVRPNETSLRAAERIALGQFGVQVRAERITYVLERSGQPLTLAILCELQDADAGAEQPGVRFVRLRADTELDPAALLAPLLEDLPSQFARGVAHVLVRYDQHGQEATEVRW